MPGNGLISLHFSVTGDDKDYSAQAEHTRLQLVNKRRSMFTPSSRKKKKEVKKKCLLSPVPAWVREGRGRERAKSQSSADCSRRRSKNVDSSPSGMLGWFRHRRHHLRSPESPRYFLPRHLQACITLKASNVAPKKKQPLEPPPKSS